MNQNYNRAVNYKIRNEIQNGDGGFINITINENYGRLSNRQTLLSLIIQNFIKPARHYGYLL